MKDLLKKIRTQLEGVEGLPAEVLSQVDSALEAFKPYEGIDPAKATDAIAFQAANAKLPGELANLQTTNQTLADSLGASKRELTAVRGLVGAGIRPEYESLVLPQVTAKLTVGDDGSIAAPDGLYDELKTAYPAAFFAEDAAGSGGTEGSGSPGDSPTVYKPERGIVMGVDPADLASGKVVLG